MFANLLFHLQILSHQAATTLRKLKLLRRARWVSLYSNVIFLYDFYIITLWSTDPMCPYGYHRSGFAATHKHEHTVEGCSVYLGDISVHCMPKFTSCCTASVVIIGRAHLVSWPHSLLYLFVPLVTYWALLQHNCCFNEFYSVKKPPEVNRQQVNHVILMSLLQKKISIQVSWMKKNKNVGGRGKGTKSKW